MSFQSWKPEFARQLKDARISRRLSQVTAAELMGISRRNLMRLEDPSHEDSPSVDTLVKIVSFYGLDVRDLLGLINRK
ncbi:MAG: helix-turn-helix transcriptional regulator [Oscillospiraceae bacterium]|nr:helix-turn-helix transcriptional regulator [Oscillospiraceae bacterium]